MDQEPSSPPALSVPERNRRAVLLGARATMHAVEVNASTRFDAVILVLSSAALALSVVLARDYFPEPVGRSRLLMLLARLDFLASIGTSLCALQASRLATRHEMRMIDRVMAEPAATRTESGWTTSGDVLRWVALGTFAGGTVFLLGYAMANLRGS